MRTDAISRTAAYHKELAMAEIMTDTEIIGVVRAHLSGKEIQATPLVTKAEPVEVCDVPAQVWFDTAGPPSWNFSAYKYRVKPKPIVVWVNVYEEGTDKQEVIMHTTEEDAKRHFSAVRAGGRRAVRMIEAP